MYYQSSRDIHDKNSERACIDMIERPKQFWKNKSIYHNSFSQFFEGPKEEEQSRNSMLN